MPPEPCQVSLLMKILLHRGDYVLKVQNLTCGDEDGLIEDTFVEVLSGISVC